MFVAQKRSSEPGSIAFYPVGEAGFLRQHHVPKSTWEIQCYTMHLTHSYVH